MINYSEKYRYFLWLPPKTGSIRASGIFKKLGFVTKHMPDGPIISPMIHTHDIELFPGSENYKLISTGRNPYTRMVSHFKMQHGSRPSDDDKERFMRYIMTFFYSESYETMNYSFYQFKNYWNRRVPDYYIRLENMYEDYLKIPFVLETELYQTGELQKLCVEKVNVNKHNTKFWKEYYTDESADMVFYNFSKYFEKLGYDKNSYKF